LGTEEYELLVSTLNKLPTLKEKLTSERKQYELARRMVSSQKVEIDDIQTELATRDLQIEKIDTKLEEINQQVEKLDQEIADLDENMKIEEEKVRPYSQAVDDASMHVREARKSSWNDSTLRWGVFSLLGVGACVFYFFSYAAEDWQFISTCCVGLMWPFLIVAFFYSSEGDDVNVDIRSTRILIHKEYEKTNKLSEVSQALHGFSANKRIKYYEKESLVIEGRKLQDLKGRLMGIEKKLKRRNKKLDYSEERVSTYSMSIESLEKEIVDGQNAIAPLIPYSDLAEDAGFSSAETSPAEPVIWDEEEEDEDPSESHRW